MSARGNKPLGALGRVTPGEGAPGSALRRGSGRRSSWEFPKEELREEGFLEISGGVAPGGGPPGGSQRRSAGRRKLLGALGGVTVQYNTKTMQDNTMRYNTTQYNTVQYITVQCTAIQYKYNVIQTQVHSEEEELPGKELRE